MTFEQELTNVLNRHSAENASDTPDYILAQYLLACLAAWNAATTARDAWWGTQSSTVIPTATEPRR